MFVQRDEWSGLFQELQRKISDPVPLISSIGDVIRQSTLENFGPTGTNRPNEWEPLSADYARKVKRTYATLDLTGTLKNSIQMPMVSGFTVSIVAGDEKASYHQLGEGHNKTRKFFPIDDDNGELTQYCQERINGELHKFFSINT